MKTFKELCKGMFTSWVKVNDYDQIERSYNERTGKFRIVRTWPESHGETGVKVLYEGNDESQAEKAWSEELAKYPE
jgi:hypothetical protein